MFVRVTGTRKVEQSVEFVFDAQDGESLDKIEELLNSPENFYKLSDYVDYMDSSQESTPFRVTRVKKKPTLDDTIVTHEELCRMK